MELEKQIQADMVSAMKAKEAGRLASLRAIKAAILLAKTDVRDILLFLHITIVR